MTPERWVYLGGGVWGDPTPACVCGCPARQHEWEEPTAYAAMAGNISRTVKRPGGTTGPCACGMCGYYESTDAA